MSMTFVVFGIKVHGFGKKTDVVLTLGRFGAVPCLLQGGQQHGGKDGDDGNNDQQFNQRER